MIDLLVISLEVPVGSLRIQAVSDAIVRLRDVARESQVLLGRDICVVSAVLMADDRLQVSVRKAICGIVTAIGERTRVSCTLGDTDLGAWIEPADQKWPYITDPTELPVDAGDYERFRKALRTGGGFASKLGIAFDAGDSENRRRIYDAFRQVFGD